jgi:hypothetical protein
VTTRGEDCVAELAGDSAKRGDCGLTKVKGGGVGWGSGRVDLRAA